MQAHSQPRPKNWTIERMQDVNLEGAVCVGPGWFWLATPCNAGRDKWCENGD